MSETVKLPQLGLDMAEGTFLNWVKNVGDSVNEGDVIAEIEADKATIEVVSTASGTLVETLVQAGDVVPVGNPIATIGAAGEKPVASGNGNGAAEASAPLAASPESSVSAPSTAPGDQQQDQKPQTVAANAPANTVATSAPTGASSNGNPSNPPAPETKQANAAAPMGAPSTVDTSPSGTAAATNGAVNVTKSATSNGASTTTSNGTNPSVGDEYPGGVKASPLARNVAKDRGIDLKLVRGTGPDGRIERKDVENYKPEAAQPVQSGSAEHKPDTASGASAGDAPSGASEEQPAAQVQTQTQQPQTQAAPTQAAKPAGSSPRIPAGMTYEEIPLTRMRKRIAERTVESKSQIPHFYLTNEVDMAAAVALRKQINEGLPDADKVTINDMVVKAVALSLRKFPNLNSHYYGDKLIRYKNINVGIAVALETGLINVVAKDADSMSISAMAARNKMMIEAVKANKVSPEFIEGSTFTVSNLGMYGIESFQAIINPPEAGIIAVGASKDVVVVEKGETKIATRMKLTISVDHRVSDGAEGAQFLVHLKALLEAPMRLLV